MDHANLRLKFVRNRHFLSRIDNGSLNVFQAYEMTLGKIMAVKSI